MKERPIVFSGSMVGTVLGGRKAQMRRIIKPVPDTQSRGQKAPAVPVVVKTASSSGARCR